MTRFFLLSAAALLVFWSPASAEEETCAQLIREISDNLRLVQERSSNLKDGYYQKLVADLLVDATKLIGDARKDCKADASLVDKSVGVSRVLAAQGLISSASVVIKLN